MLREQCSDLANAGQRAFFITAGAKRGLHPAANRLPFLRFYFPVDAAVGDDLDLAIDKLHIDQHAAVVLGVPYAQPREYLDGAIARRAAVQQKPQVQSRFDGETDLTAVLPLGIADHALDRVQRRFGKRAVGDPLRRKQMFNDAFRLIVYPF